MLQKPRGTLDILPKEAKIWQYVEDTIIKIAAKYGFEQLRIPTFESTEVYKRGVGETTDVVSKEMYTFFDNDKRSLTLRPEGTAGVVRSVIENGLCNEALPLGVYYLISCFRYEKPEAGRSREFFQFGAELFGADSPVADAQIIVFVKEIFDTLGLSVEVNINSIGCKRCRPFYHKALKEHFGKDKDKLCEACISRLESNPLRLLDCKNDNCIELSKSAPVLSDYLCDDCKAHFERLCALLDGAGVSYKVNPKIVRGLDYYQKTVFEFISNDIGSQSTICGGGRYDGLVEEMGGPAISGIGFAMGLTRLILALKSKGFDFSVDTPDLYIATLDKNSESVALNLSLALRDHGICVAQDMVGRSLKAQFKYADKKDFKFVAVIGSGEIESGEIKLKNMKSSEEISVKINDIESMTNIIRGAKNV